MQQNLTRHYFTIKKMNLSSTLNILSNFNNDPGYFEIHKITVDGERAFIETGCTTPEEKQKCIAIWTRIANEPSNALVEQAREDIVSLAKRSLTQNEPDLLPLFHSIITQLTLLFTQILEMRQKK